MQTSVVFINCIGTRHTKRNMRVNEEQANKILLMYSPKLKYRFLGQSVNVINCRATLIICQMIPLKRLQKGINSTNTAEKVQFSEVKNQFSEKKSLAVVMKE